MFHLQKHTKYIKIAQKLLSHDFQTKFLLFQADFMWKVPYVERIIRVELATQSNRTKYLKSVVTTTIRVIACNKIPILIPSKKQKHV